MISNFKNQKWREHKTVGYSKRRTVSIAKRLDILADYYSRSLTIQSIWDKYEISRSTLYRFKICHDQIGVRAWKRNSEEEENFRERMIMDSATEFLINKFPFNSSDIRTSIAKKHKVNVQKNKIVSCLKHDLNLSYK